MKRHPSKAARLISLAAFAALAACSQGADGIDQSGAIYDGIAPEATISLTGTEPFWAMEIAPSGETGFTARYSTPEDIEGRSFALERFAGNNGLGFSGELDGAPVQIAITPGECSDGMSDRTYPFTATVALGEDSLFGCAHTDSASFEGPPAP